MHPQVFDNCRLYNPAGTNVRTWGDDLSEAFERAWSSSGVEERWQLLQGQRYLQEVSIWMSCYCTLKIWPRTV